MSENGSVLLCIVVALVGFACGILFHAVIFREIPPTKQAQKAWVLHELEHNGGSDTDRLSLYVDGQWWTVFERKKS